MVHTFQIEWHDLLEDPTDLPTKKGLYLVTLMNKKDHEQFDTSNDPMPYILKHKVWKDTYIDEYGEVEGEAHFESFGTEASTKFKNLVNPYWVVVAWAERPMDYIPQKLQGS